VKEKLQELTQREGPIKRKLEGLLEGLKRGQMQKDEQIAELSLTLRQWKNSTKTSLKAIQEAYNAERVVLDKAQEKLAAAQESLQLDKTQEELAAQNRLTLDEAQEKPAMAPQGASDDASRLLEAARMNIYDVSSSLERLGASQVEPTLKTALKNLDDVSRLLGVVKENICEVASSLGGLAPSQVEVNLAAALEDLEQI
jgi:Mrp family chromosome partitioning ATPase